MIDRMLIDLTCYRILDACGAGSAVTEPGIISHIRVSVMSLFTMGAWQEEEEEEGESFHA